MREIAKISESLFEKIRDRFEDVSLGDENAKATQTPEDARFFNFDYVVDGHNYGNITLSIIDETSLKVYFSKNISKDLSDEEQKQWYSFLRELREFAKRNLLSFEPRDITRATLKHRDIHQQSKADSTFSKDEVMAESRMYGTSRSSYENDGNVRIIVRHNDHIDPEQRGARARKIRAIYLETSEGERFKLPHNSLRYARAMARHVSEGGTLNDEFGQHITEIADECSKLRPFKRGVMRRTFEDAETQQMVEAAFEYHGLLSNTLKRMGGKKGYHACKENWSIDDSVLLDNIDVDSIRERFVKRVYNDSMDTALPIVQKAYEMKKQNKFAKQFESWANDVISENEDSTYDELLELLGDELPVGVDAANATSALEGTVIADNEMYDSLVDELLVLSDMDPNEDARDTILGWMQTEMPQEYRDLVSNYNVEEGVTGSAFGGVDGVVGEQDVEANGHDDVAAAIIRKIIYGKHTELLKKLGPDGVLAAAREVAAYVGPVDEIGSSDLSILVAQIEKDAGIQSKLEMQEEEYCDACDSTECHCDETQLDEGKMKDIALDIEELSNKQFRAKYGKSKDEVKAELAEGLTGLQKLGAGAAMIGALASNAYLDNKTVEASPQMQKLEQLYQQALANDDVAKADELEDRIENLRARLELGKGEVVDAHGNPIEPKYESTETHLEEMRRLAGL